MSKENYTIKKVDENQNYYTILTNDSISFIIYKKYGVTPKNGDIVTLHTKGFSFIRGIELNGEVLFYKTDEELEIQREKELQEMEERKQQKFVENVEKMDEQYEKLPEHFKQRIDRFRKNNPRFRIDYEDYELFCCEQAIIIADACKTPEEVVLFKDKKWDEQIEQVKDLSHDHSVNTFGCACQLAYHYLFNPDNLVKIHGALSNLVGSEEYGDIER